MMSAPRMRIARGRVARSFRTLSVTPLLGFSPKS